MNIYKIEYKKNNLKVDKDTNNKNIHFFPKILFCDDFKLKIACIHCLHCATTSTLLYYYKKMV